jgi:hypothetical protein
MKILSFLFCIMVLVSCSHDEVHLGLPFTIPAEQSLNVSDALKPANYDRPVRVEGECYRVCQSEGCWLIVTDGKEKLRVTMKNNDFAAPMDLGSKKIMLEGKVSEILSSEEDARSYAENAGKSEAETNAIVGDQRVPVLVVSALEIK